jgi:hypothetical protein
MCLLEIISRLKEELKKKSTGVSIAIVAFVSYGASNSCRRAQTTPDASFGPVLVVTDHPNQLWWWPFVVPGAVVVPVPYASILFVK